MHRKITAAVAALALTLALVPVVSAGSIGESLSVNSILTVTGIPATVNYGAVDPGQLSAGVQGFTASVVSNSAWVFRLSGSDLTGPTTIGKAARIGRVTNPTGTTGVATTPSNWFPFDNVALNGTTNNATGTAGTGGFHVDLRIDLSENAGAPAGAYSGTLTYTVTAS